MPLRTSRGRKMRSATTRAKELRAERNQRLALDALREGRELRVSSRTDVEAGTVHAGLARYLVRMRWARYLPHPEHEADMTRIKGTS